MACQTTPPPSLQAHWIPDDAPDLGAVVARVASVPIFASQIAAQAAKSKVSPREALDELVRFHLLAEKARATGVPFGNPGADLRSVRVQRYIEREIEPKMTMDQIPSDILRPAYDAALDHFVHPRLVNIEIVALFTGTRATTERKAAARQTALDLEKYVRAHPNQNTLDLKALVASATWANRGITLTTTSQGINKPYIAKVGTAVQKLKRKGEWTPLIDDGGDTGYYIARYIDEIPAKNVSFSQALPDLRVRYFEQWKPVRFTELVRELGKGRKVEVDPTALAVKTKP